MRVKAHFLLKILFLISSSSCSLFWGEKTLKKVTITHLASSLIQNNGIGNDWETPLYSINATPIAQFSETILTLTSWDNIEIKCTYTELDETYPDISSGFFREQIWKIEKEYGDNFPLGIDTYVYETRTEKPSNSGDYALWKDSFLFLIEEAEQ